LGDVIRGPKAGDIQQKKIVMAIHGGRGGEMGDRDCKRGLWCRERYQLFSEKTKCGRFR